MRTFKDDTGTEWELSITVGTIRRTRTEFTGRLPGREVDLLKIDEGSPPLVALLSVDVELIVDLIWSLVRHRKDDKPADPEAFALAMGGDAMIVATAAFWGEMRDFFLKLGRTDLVAVIQTQADLFAVTIEKTTNNMTQDQLGQMVDAEIAKARAAKEAASQPTPGSDSTSLPESSASTPTPLPSAS